LAWLFLSTFIPGVLLSLAILKKNEDLRLLDKVFVGFALGFFLLPMIPFLLYFFAGVKFSYTIALLSVGALYAVSLAAFFLTKAHEGITLPKKLTKEHILPALLIILLIASYLVRIGTYSPIFQELDPYFYTYPADQLLTLGENPFDAQTAWYPEVTVNHRITPALSYLESTWYSLYSGGGEFNNLLLALIASMYPPIAATLAVFFIYLFISLITKKREWGLLAAGIFAFAPISIFKLAAGEQEVQPYAFFAMFFFYAMYVIALKRKDLLRFEGERIVLGKDLAYPVLAGIAFASLTMGSASQVLVVLSLIMFLGIQSALLFIREEKADELRHLLVSNSIIFLIGPLLAGSLILGFFTSDQPFLTYSIIYAIGLAIVAALYALKTRIPDRSTSLTVMGGLVIVGMILVFFTPLGDYVKQPAMGGFATTQFNSPLDRTIAEQAVAGTSFGGQMGFVAESFYPPPSLGSIGDLVGLIMHLLMLPFSVAGNLLLSVIVDLINFTLGTTALFTAKDTSLLFLWVVLFFAAVIHNGFRFFRKEDDHLIILVLAITVPPLLVGIIKAKFTLYATAMLAVVVGYTFNQTGGWAERFIKEQKDREMAYKLLLGLAALIIVMQFVQQGFASSLLWASIQPLYQNDPVALAPKFQQMCTATGDAEACAAAADPMGYASLGTNYQYSTRLCMLSLFSKYEYLTGALPAPAWESQAAMFRCQRISHYWIESMEWIRDNTPEGSRTTSWWDYGHWINYFGQRNAVLRNEHASHTMIGAVADGYLDATPEELKAWMEAHDSEYALFDVELVAGGGSLGGKYGALNYLSCAYNKETTVAKSPGESQCESDHLWENIFVSSNPCTISSLTNKTGVVAYKLYVGDSYLPEYPGFCLQPEDPNVVAYCRDAFKPVPVYCVGEATLATGDPTYATYYLNETYPNGDLKLNKAFLQLPSNYATTYHFGPVTRVTLVYTMDPIWLENGEVKSGYEDRKGEFYDSNLYRAIFLNDIPGFDLAYSTSGGEVKIFKIR